MANLKQWLCSAEIEVDETINEIIIGEHYDDERNTDMLNVPLARDVALSILDEDFDSGYGGADCYPFYAYTDSWIFFVSEYDGSTRLSRVPRNPIPTEPEFM